VTDGLPALALASEPAEKDIMKRKPRRSGESIFAGGLGKHVLWVGVLIGFICIGTQTYLVNKDVEHWQTMVFTILCFCQLWHVLAIRSDIRSLFRQGLFSNKTLLGAVILTIILQMAIIYIPAMNDFFHTSPLTMMELGAVIAISSITFWAVEIEKAIKRKLVN
jgi:Ca2+-transporting ATPase